MAGGCIVVAAPAATLDARPLSTNVDVSHARGPQSEVSLAVDRRRPATLVAAAISLDLAAIDSYTSIDGGRSWTAARVPLPSGSRRCGGASDPAVAIDGTSGREYVASTVPAGCGQGLSIYVASRGGPRMKWSPADAPASPPAQGEENYDKPAIAVDDAPASPHAGRVYVAYANDETGTVNLIHSDGGEQGWSPPLPIGKGTFASLATASDGTLYVAWWRNRALYLAASRDGGDHVSTIRATALLHGPPWRPPAQRTRGVTPSPTLAVDRSSGRFRDRIYLSFANQRSDGALNIYVLAFSPGLARAPSFAQPRAIPTAGRRADRFLPAVAVDASNGRVWDCFYDSGAGAERTAATFSCVNSRNGGADWSRVRHVAARPSRWPSQHDRVGRFAFGDYEGVAAAGGVAYAVWTDTRDVRRLSGEIYAASLRSGGWEPFH